MSVVAERLAALVDRHALPPTARPALEGLLVLLEGDDHAPTSVRDADTAVNTHIADSLSALDVAPLRGAARIADLGAGAGFPGLALAAALPDTEVVLVESAGRKCEFLERAIQVMGVTGARVVNDRAETWVDGLVSCDAVTARAVAPLPVVVEYAAPLLVSGGTFVAWKGRRDAVEEADAVAASAATGLEATAIVRVVPFKGAHDLHLHVYLKVGFTPNRYPRRAGMARKRPITTST